MHKVNDLACVKISYVIYISLYVDNWVCSISADRQYYLGVGGWGSGTLWGVYRTHWSRSKTWVEDLGWRVCMICYPLTPTPPTFHLPNNTAYVSANMYYWTSVFLNATLRVQINFLLITLLPVNGFVQLICLRIVFYGCVCFNNTYRYYIMIRLLVSCFLLIRFWDHTVSSHLQHRFEMLGVLLYWH